jgi:hypothetical protein
MDSLFIQEIETLTQQWTRKIVRPDVSLEDAEKFAREDWFTYESLKLRNRIMEKRKEMELKYPVTYASFVREVNLELKKGSPAERHFYRIHLLRIREEYEKNTIQ